MGTRNRLAAVAVLAGATACSSTTTGSGTGPASVGPSALAPGSSAATSSPPATPTRASSSTPSSAAGSSAAPVSSSPRASSSAHPLPARPVRTATATASDGRTKYVIKIWAEDNVTDCAAHAYGTPVIHYLRTHDCRGIRRLLATTTVGGLRVGFAQSDVGFNGATVDESYAAAGHFRTLVTKDGTGNIDDLFRDGYRLPAGPSSVPSPDAFSASAQDNGCTVVDAWYLDRTTPANDPALVRMAQDIYLQF